MIVSMMKNNPYLAGNTVNCCNSNTPHKNASVQERMVNPILYMRVKLLNKFLPPQEEG